MKDELTVLVDIDGILTVEWKNWGLEAYRNRTPQTETIEYINKLYDDGHKIIIFTARFPEDENITRIWLREHNVKFHRLISGKPLCDIMIDDKTVNNLEDLRAFIENRNLS